MPPKSSVKSLPKDLKFQIDTMIIDGIMTLDDLSAYIVDQGHEISRSALGRYSKTFTSTAAKMNQMKEMAKAFADELGDDVDTDAHKVVVQMLHTIFMRISMDEIGSDDPSMKPKDIMMLSAALKNMMGSVKDRQKIEENALIKARKEAANDASKSMRKAGLSVEQVAFWREEFLGVKPKEKG
jgi:hypothetical protein